MKVNHLTFACPSSDKAPEADSPLLRCLRIGSNQGLPSVEQEAKRLPLSGAYATPVDLSSPEGIFAAGRD